MVDPSMKAAAMLEETGLSVAVINARFAKPIDKSLIMKYAKKTGCLITTEEHSVQGGFGSAVLEVLQNFDERIPLKTKCIGVPDVLIEHGATGLIKKDLKLDPEGMFETIYAFVSTTVSLKSHGNENNGFKNDLKKPIAVKTAND
jgi:1-deoxy-D-xylulose-5-phosphate synthase